MARAADDAAVAPSDTPAAPQHAVRLDPNLQQQQQQQQQQQEKETYGPDVTDMSDAEAAAEAAEMLLALGGHQHLQLQLVQQEQKVDHAPHRSAFAAAEVTLTGPFTNMSASLPSKRQARMTAAAKAAAAAASASEAAAAAVEACQGLLQPGQQLPPLSELLSAAAALAKRMTRQQQQQQKQQHRQGGSGTTLRIARGPANAPASPATSGGTAATGDQPYNLSGKQAAAAAAPFKGVGAAALRLSSAAAGKKKTHSASLAAANRPASGGNAMTNGRHGAGSSAAATLQRAASTPQLQLRQQQQAQTDLDMLYMSGQSSSGSRRLPTPPAASMLTLEGTLLHAQLQLARDSTSEPGTVSAAGPSTLTLLESPFQQAAAADGGGFPLPASLALANTGVSLHSSSQEVYAAHPARSGSGKWAALHLLHQAQMAIADSSSTSLLASMASDAAVAAAHSLEEPGAFCL